LHRAIAGEEGRFAEQEPGIGNEKLKTGDPFCDANLRPRIAIQHCLPAQDDAYPREALKIAALYGSDRLLQLARLSSAEVPLIPKTALEPNNQGAD
jgi:hypothetical protein